MLSSAENRELEVAFCFHESQGYHLGINRKPPGSKIRLKLQKNDGAKKFKQKMRKTFSGNYFLVFFIFWQNHREITGKKINVRQNTYFSMFSRFRNHREITGKSPGQKINQKMTKNN